MYYVKFLNPISWTYSLSLFNIKMKSYKTCNIEEIIKVNDLIEMVRFRYLLKFDNLYLLFNLFSLTLFQYKCSSTLDFGFLLLVIIQFDM